MRGRSNEGKYDYDCSIHFVTAQSPFLEGLQPSTAFYIPWGNKNHAGTAVLSLRTLHLAYQLQYTVKLTY